MKAGRKKERGGACPTNEKIVLVPRNGFYCSVFVLTVMCVFLFFPFYCVLLCDFHNK